MSALKREIVETIAHDGPMTLERYMSLCLTHPRYGYYMTRDPFGAGGDFVTAPEISQMFGELLGVWVTEAWRAAGAPTKARLVELGPGRGTLMSDVLRVTPIAPNFFSAVSVHLVETSPVLREDATPDAGQGREAGAMAFGFCRDAARSRLHPRQ